MSLKQLVHKVFWSKTKTLTLFLNLILIGFLTLTLTFIKNVDMTTINLTLSLSLSAMLAHITQPINLFLLLTLNEIYFIISKWCDVILTLSKKIMFADLNLTSDLVADRQTDRYYWQYYLSAHANVPLPFLTWMSCCLAFNRGQCITHAWTPMHY